MGSDDERLFGLRSSSDNERLMGIVGAAIDVDEDVPLLMLRLPRVGTLPEDEVSLRQAGTGGGRLGCGEVAIFLLAG
jgi:hypothetical protein